MRPLAPPRATPPGVSRATDRSPIAHRRSTRARLLRHAADVTVTVDAPSDSRDVTLVLHLPTDVPREDIDVTVFTDRVRVRVANADEPALEGTLPSDVDVDGCFWDKEATRVTLTLEKANRRDAWDRVLELPPGNDEVTTRCFFDVGVNGKARGRIVFGLFGKHSPRTVENFRALCEGEMGESPRSGKRLTYEGSCFHRIVKGFVCQGGDFTSQNGRGGESIYGEEFEDEAFGMSHDAAGVLSMANHGPNTNGSQFFITTGPAPSLDDAHVVFGRVLEGMDVVEAIDAVGSDTGQPRGQACITKCGELKS